MTLHRIKLSPTGDRWDVTGAVRLERVRHPVVAAAAVMLESGAASLDDSIRVEWPEMMPFDVSIAATASYRPSADRRAWEAERKEHRHVR